MNPNTCKLSRKLGLTAILVGICVILCAGVAFGRFHSKIFGDVMLTPEEPDQVYLFSGKDESGAYLQSPAQWSGANPSKLSFYVTNGTDASHFSGDDQAVTVRLIAGLGVMDVQSAAVSLQVEGTVYQAEVARIPQDTSLYQEFGDGWIFRFLDSNGREVTWELEGQQLSELLMQLQITGLSDVEESLLRLQVSGVSVP